MHLIRSWANPDHTLILISVDGIGGRLCQTRSERVTDLVIAAQSLLNEAKDRLDEKATGRKERVLWNQVISALTFLPDPVVDTEEPA